jgi:hypothetical protein
MYEPEDVDAHSSQELFLQDLESAFGQLPPDSPDEDDADGT